MSGTSPRWELDASVWPGVKPDSGIYLEVQGKLQDNGLKLEKATSGHNDTTATAKDVITISVSTFKDYIASFLHNANNNVADYESTFFFSVSGGLQIS